MRRRIRVTTRRAAPAMLGCERAAGPAPIEGRRLVPCARKGQPPTIQASAEARPRHHRWSPAGRVGAQDAQEYSQAGEAHVKVLIVVEKTRTGYSAYSPDISGCVATGATRRQVEGRMRSALALHLRGFGGGGHKPPRLQTYATYVEV